MESLPANATDLTIIGILLISGILAYSRGLVRELLSVAGWAGAILATLYGFSYVKPYVRSWIDIPILADAAAGIALFVFTLILLTFISHSISGVVQKSALGAIDHSLGFLFGLVRGALLVCLAYILLAWVMPEDEQPQWIVTARTIPFVKQGAEMLRDIVPESIAEQSEEKADEVKEDIDQQIQEQFDEAIERQKQRLLEDLTSPSPKAPDEADESGYNPDERRDMDRLFQSEQNR